jgi:hypothetical protein
MGHRIEAGTYRARAIKGSEQYGQTSNGNDQIVIDLDLLDLGEKISTFLVFTDKAAQWSLDRLRACGWTGDDLSNLDGIDANEVEVEVAYEMYKGEEKMKVQIRTSGGAVKLKDQLDDKGKKAFAAKYRDLAKSVTAKAPAAPKSEEKTDISF